MIADRHLHTWFSEDSNEDPENVIKAALRLGMKDVYITDHYDIDFPDRLFWLDVDRYFEELSKLKDRYAGIIGVHIGVELGLKADISDKIDALLKAYPFEYVIGSIHLMDGKDPYCRDLFDMDDEEYYRLFFRESLDSIRACGGFDTFGHLDFAVRYGYGRDKDYQYERYAELIDGILKEIIKKDAALEINTAGARKGLGYFHPYPDVLKRYREMGGRKLAAGSDAHSADAVGYGFTEILGYIGRFGFGKDDLI